MLNNYKNCKVNGCENPAFNDFEECALHCKKNGYSQDWNSGLLSDFYKYLERYLSNCSKEEVVIFLNIHFPFRDNRDIFDYFKILKDLKEIHFLRCVFYSHSINLFPTKIFYDECYFVNNFDIFPTNMLENALDSIFSICNFLGNVDIYGYNENINQESSKFDFSLFSECKFNKKLSIHSCIFNNGVFNNYDDRMKIHHVMINQSIFNDRFSLNHSDIDILEVSDCQFLSKLEIKDSKIEKLLFENSNVAKVADFFGSKIHSFKIQKSIFDDFVGFENVDFGFKDTELSNDNDLAIFKYATFMSFVNFRSAKFYQGLDISNANFKEVPNFFNAQILSDNTNRESFRIIKDSFDKSGNHIEANNYFIQEMKAYKQEMKNDDKRKFDKYQKFIIYTNEEISSFGQSYIKPLIILFLSSIIYWSIKSIHKIIFIKGNRELIFPLNKFSDFLNDLAKNFFPFSSFIEKHQGLEFVSLLFYIWFSVLIWQIVVAVKRHTIR